MSNAEDAQKDPHLWGRYSDADPKRMLEFPTLVEWQGRIETKSEILACV